MQALITGAGSGIGRATAMRLARDAQQRGSDGSRLMLVDLDGDALQETVQSLRSIGIPTLTIVEDLAAPDACARVAEHARVHLGRLDVLVSNAGIGRGSALVELSLQAYDLEFAVNTRATWLLVKELHVLLREAQGCVVVTASMSASAPTPDLGAYSASKAAVTMLGGGQPDPVGTPGYERHRLVERP